jgi:hypothetical protein
MSRHMVGSVSSADTKKGMLTDANVSSGCLRCLFPVYSVVARREKPARLPVIIVLSSSAKQRI